MSPICQPQPGAGTEVSERAGDSAGTCSATGSHHTGRSGSPLGLKWELPKALLCVLAPGLLLCEVSTVSQGGGKHFHCPLIWLPMCRRVGHCGFSVWGMKKVIFGSRKHPSSVPITSITKWLCFRALVLLRLPPGKSLSLEASAALQGSH